MDIAYTTNFGTFFKGKIEELFESSTFKIYRKKVNLILTSPPFPLNRKKAYGNFTGQEYMSWLAGLAPLFNDLISDNGSIVIEIGNAWEKGKPTMSTLPLRVLLAILDSGSLNLCQQFIFYNKARLPSPVQWVNVERIRVKDSFTHIWWMSKSDRPKANNRQVLKEYSPSMVSLLAKQKYNPGKRPSEYDIGTKSFLRDNKGSIPGNVLVFANTSASDPYQKYCRKKSLKPHPSRMAYGVAEFFIKFLTDPGDIVLDPFAGSNTTGAVAEELERQWISIEPNDGYIEGSLGRFDPSNIVNSSIR